ncbi:hypothetical protein FT663_00967 [Candidozyma haemuli var. vulneris]|uniref:Exportin-T n=1 Tax=Candidozyma haemuli TaxID=45357 RepID=A0A2V1AUH7_9ASCO|nr:hypothetical protein CXQ85_000788 [[Candida] haemuloni]KAF3986267.1 hypothetical protein FT662_04669 [[Candida] haemuloni var. vulneris]KAF3994862.1 hypothetical protein FT663_00967 [[Candida] haemuloni var. vulneris]PVH21797.1 hypothetical protein CXQ85_000788 [[Candida] haemuloni]
MDQQIQQAVDIALSGTADPSLKSQAFTFINEIKSTEQGYQTCFDLLLADPSKGIHLNDGLKFFILQVIEENTEKLGEQQLYDLNTRLFKYLDSLVAADHHDQVHLKNKLSDLFGSLFCLAYSQINTEFIKSLLMLIQSSNLLSIDYYLRILISIHFHIGDKLISRSKEAQNRSNVLKDLIRERDMPQLVESWKTILTTVKDTTLLDNALKVVGSYVNWMEISMFIQNGFIGIIYEFLKSSPQLRNQSCVTLVEIISKKMKPASKLELINLLDLTSVIGSLKDDDLDFIENLAKLANQIGIELAIVLENDGSLLNDINVHFLKLWPTILEFLGHEYDDVSQQIFPFIQAYLLLAKKYNDLNSVDLLSALLKKIIIKMKYDEDADAFDDDEQFADVRSKLKTFQDTIAILNPQMYLEMMPMIIENSIFNASSDDWPSVELGLYELSNFGDSLKNNLVNFPKTEITTSKPYQEVQSFLIKIINNFTSINHPKNHLAFFELIIRHFSTKSFNNTTNTSIDELVIKILELFSEYGLFNSLESVRLRTWYLFFRFVNITKPKLNDYFLENLLIKFQPLLVIKAELPTRDEDDDIVENGNFSSQLYLFEALGILISMADSPDATARSIDILFNPLFSSLETCISREDKDVNPLIPLQANHSLMALATVTRGLDTQAPGKSTAAKHDAKVVGKVGDAAQVVLITLENLNKSENVRDAARFAFARLMPILDVQSSSHLSKLISLILASPKLKINELGDFLSFVGQIVHQFKDNDGMFHLLNDLITPMIRKIFELLSADEENNPHVTRDKYQLKKSFLNFISIVVINNQFSLLLTETNKPIFPQVVSSIIEYSQDLNDLPTAKSAIVQFGNVIAVLGCNNGKITDAKDKLSTTLAPIEGIDEYLMESTVKLCFELPFSNAAFDLSEASLRNLAQDLSLLLKTYQNRSSQGEFVNFLVNYLVNVGLSQDLTNDFGQKLVDMDAKSFKKYYVTFLSELKK